MPLPYAMPAVSPFDTITAQETNERIANILALAAGTGFNAGAIPTAAIANGAITAAKTTGIWWEEIGRTTLSVAGDLLSVSSLPSRKYLKIFVAVNATGGTVTARMRFNNDSGSNYAYRENFNGAESAASSTSFIDIGAGVVTAPTFIELSVLNISTIEKSVITAGMSPGATGAANAPSKSDNRGKWANTSVVINRIDIVNQGSGDFAIGSEIVVLGHN